MGYGGSTEVSDSLKGIQDLFGVVPWDPREPLASKEVQGGQRRSKIIQRGFKIVQRGFKWV